MTPTAVPTARWNLFLLVLAALALTAFTAGVAKGDDGLPRAVSQEDFNVLNAPAVDSGIGPASLGDIKHPASPICGPAAGTGSDATNVNTDCETAAEPHNETSIAVNPTNPANIIGGANDYQLITTAGGTVKETVLSRAHVSFDGGASWAEYPVPFVSYTGTGDPGIAFDASGRAYYSTLGFLFSQGKSPTETSADVLVAHSTDGGKSWSTPARVGQGVGALTSVSMASLDKPYITAWGDGNAIVTWSNFVSAQKGAYVSSPIYDSVTHDGGVTWTKPQEISGSAPFCIGSGGGDACDQDQFSVPVVSAGSIDVAFESLANTTNFADQYLVVKVDPATGARVAGPYKVSDLVDGIDAYPVDAVGRQTYQDSQMRTNSAGNIAADPTTPGHLALVWSDMRDSTVPLPDLNPYDVATNSDVVVSQSFDGGATWSSPVALTLRNDQFMPWGAYDTTGTLRIGLFDRAYDSANHEYGYSLATETSPGSLSFTTVQLTTTLSQPTMGDRWFSGLTVNQAFPHPTQFMGDYSNIASDDSGGVVAYWTDMRNSVFFPARSGFGEDAFFAHSP